MFLVLVQPLAFGDIYGHRPSTDQYKWPATYTHAYRPSPGPVKDSKQVNFAEGSVGLGVELYSYTQNADAAQDDYYQIVLQASANSRLAHQFNSPSYGNHWDLNRCPSDPNCNDTGLSTVNSGKWINLAWNFYFYGQPYNQVFVCSDGYVAFVYSQTATTCPSSGSLPNQAIDSNGNILGIPSSVIAPWWKNLNVGRYNTAHVYTTGYVANDPSHPQCSGCTVHTFGVTWYNIPIADGGCNHDCFPLCFPCDSTFSMTFDSTGAIYFGYGTMDSGLSLSTSGTPNGLIGVDDASGTLYTTADANSAVTNGGFMIQQANYPVPPECMCNYNMPYAWLNDLQLKFDDSYITGDGQALDPNGIPGNLYGHSIQTASTPPTCDSNCQSVGSVVDAALVTVLCLAVPLIGCIGITAVDAAKGSILAALQAGSAQYTDTPLNDAAGVDHGLLETPIAYTGVCTCAVDASVVSVGMIWKIPHNSAVGVHKLTITFNAELGPPGGGNGFGDTSHTRGNAQEVITIDSGDFAISSSGQSSSTVAQGNSLTTNINVQSNNANINPISVGLSYKVSPNPQIDPTITSPPTATLNPTSITVAQFQTLSSTMTIQTTSSTTPTTYTMYVTGLDSSGALNHTTTFTFRVVPPDFSISANPASIITTTAVTYANSTISLTSLNGFAGTVALKVTLPTNATVNGIRMLTWQWFSPSNCAITDCNITQTLGSGATVQPVLAIFPYSNTPIGNYVVTVTGSSGSLSHSTTIIVTVNAGVSGGGGGGSLADGTLITMPDGSTVPVQNLKVGDRLLGYDPTTGTYQTSTITAIVTKHATNMLVINTASGMPLRVDASQTEVLWTRLQNGAALWLPVTQLATGDDLWTQGGWVVVTSIYYAPAGNHTMYDITATVPYFANGYLDPPHPS